jgi:hypothetical protein
MRSLQLGYLSYDYKVMNHIEVANSLELTGHESGGNCFQSYVNDGKNYITIRIFPTHIDMDNFRSNDAILDLMDRIENSDIAITGKMLRFRISMTRDYTETIYIMGCEFKMFPTNVTIYSDSSGEYYDAIEEFMKRHRIKYGHII